MIDDNHKLHRALVDAQEKGEAAVLATVIKARGSVPRHSGSKMLWFADGRQIGTIGGGEMESRVLAAAADVLADGKPRIVPYALIDPTKGDPGVCGGEMEIFMEPVLPPATVFVIGCGHVGQAIADLAHWLGYRVAVTDDRPDLASPEFIPNADIYLPMSIEQALQEFSVTSNTFITAVTRNVMVDLDALPLFIDTPAPFIGVMGSRRRWEHTKKLLVEKGVSADDLARFHSPLGLELEAETPREIAISVMAEIIMMRRGGDGRRMSNAAAKTVAG